MAVQLSQELLLQIDDLAQRVVCESLSAYDLIAFDPSDAVKQLTTHLVPLLDDAARTELRSIAVTFTRGNRTITDMDTASALLYRKVSSSAYRISSTNYISKSFPNSLLLKTFPELKKQMDDEGLVPASLFRSKQPLVNALIYKGHAIYLSEAMPPILQEKLVEIANSSAHPSLKVQLSHYKIVPLEKYEDPLEKARDRGPSFSEKQVVERMYLSNLTTVLTRRSAPEDNGIYRMCSYHEFDRMEINRNERDDKGKTLVSFFAELLNIMSAGSTAEFYQNHIFHSDLFPTKDTVTFKHADSTLLVYRRETYLKRLQKKSPDTEKAEGHFKLFWLADCPLELWIDLFHRTFPSTELLREYFSGETFDPRKELGLPPDFKLDSF